ncbi:MAG: indolepyruvate oxidoreductase subunit beta [bacterium]
MSRSAMKSSFNLIIAGVGGQGNITASQVIAQAALLEGWIATVGETYGVSQRGGSVMSHVRITRGSPLGPLIPKGDADILVGFEPLETLIVALEYGRPDLRVLVNPRPIYPIGVLAGEERYPGADRILALLRRHLEVLEIVPATELAQQIGDIRSMNLVMVGALAASGLFPLAKESYAEALRGLFEGKALESNGQAFEQGYRTLDSRSQPAPLTG